MKEVTAWKCEYCAMTSLHKSSVKRHELCSCRKNQARVTCLNCTELDYDSEDGLYCDKAEVYISVVNENIDCPYFNRLTQ